MRLDYQAEMLLSIQQERSQKYHAQIAARSGLPHKETAGARVLRASGTLLIVLGSRLQRWSGSDLNGAAAETTRKVAWR